MVLAMGCSRGAGPAADGGAEGGAAAAEGAKQSAGSAAASAGAGASAPADGGVSGAAASATAVAGGAASDSAESASVRRREVSGAKGSGLEARRSKVTHIEAEPVLSAQAAALRKQYGGALPASLAVQSTDLGADRRRAILVGVERADGTLESPMVFVVDEAGALVWSKERPAAGIKPPVGSLAIAAGPRGRFALAICDAPTSSVGLRLWDEDGSPFADFHALATNACDAISLLYWPSHGWLIAAAVGSETRAQLVTEAGALAWSGGRVLGARFRTIAPASLASDGPSSFVLVQYSQSPGADREADHAVAYRYDEHAQSLWSAPIDLGAVRRILPGQERITLARTSDGVLRAYLVGGTIIEIRSNGETRRAP
jgi:hypothetical protein